MKACLKTILCNITPYGHTPPKVPNVKFNFDVGFRYKCTDRSKPNVEIEMMSPYHSVQMST